MDNDLSAINKIATQLKYGMYSTASRNYQEGSVFVQRSGKIIGLCFDNESESTIHELNVDPADFPHLKDLVIRSSTLKSFPSWFYQFEFVENLVLKDLDIKSTNDLLYYFPNLIFLALPDNELTTLQINDSMSNLFRLNLNQNKFEGISQSILGLENLVSVTMNDNYIVNQDGSDIKSNKLQSVSLRNNLLSKFPNFLENQVHLFNLDLSYNFIHEIPDWIGEFSVIENLILSNNKISSISENLSQLNKLKLLYLDYNSNLPLNPHSVMELDQLKELNIKHSYDDDTLIKKIQSYRKIADKKFYFRF